MPIRRSVAKFGDDVGEYVAALWRHWGTLVSGAVLGLTCWGYGVAADKAIPTNLYLLLLVGAAIVAGFSAWGDEYKKRLSAEQAAGAPDVTLEGTFPEPFRLHARGHACEIRTGPIVMESAVVRTEQRGGEVFRISSPRYIVEFPVVSDLRDADNDKKLAPSLFLGLGLGRTSWERAGMDEFFQMAMACRRAEVNEPEVNLSLKHLSEQMKLPIEFGFEITFWNSEHTQQWARTEALIYDPQSNTAFVRHAGSPRNNSV
jgi:hypothetical protein